MNASRQTRDLTQGRPLTQILLFALPLVAGTLFQQLYSFVDTVMVGRFVGVAALAAVGDTYSLNFLTLGFIQGAYVGFGIPLSQSWGAGEPEELRRYYWNGWYLSAVVAVVMTVLTTLFAGPLLHLVQTPEDIFQEALAYVRIIFLGLPVTILYNYGANTLRSVGDSRHPLYFLLISSGGEYPAGLPLYGAPPDGGAGRGPGHCAEPGPQRGAVPLVAPQQDGRGGLPAGGAAVLRAARQADVRGGPAHGV